MIYRFANVDFDAAQGELRIDGQLVPFERRPSRLLEGLLLHVNEVVTKEALFDSVWNGRTTRCGSMRFRSRRSG